MGQGSNRGGGAPSPAAKAEQQLYHVAGPGSVVVDGKTYKPGRTLRLTEEQAKGVPGLKKGEPPKEQTPVEQRKAGRYVVALPILRSGESLKVGATYDFSEAEAKQLGSSLRDPG